MDDYQTALGAKKKLQAASFSLAVNVLLILLKLSVVYVTGSLAILAELLHSFFDMLASIFAYAGIRKAQEPADDSHLFGHEKFENLSSLAQTVLIVITSFVIIYEAYGRILKPVKVESSELGLAVMVLTIIIDYSLAKYLHKTSKDYGSVALEADAYHFSTDLWGAVSVIVGLVFVALGFPVFDSIAAIAVAILMLWISYHLGIKAIHALTDMSPPKKVIDRISESVSSTNGVESFHKLRVRQAGSKYLVEVHIQVSPKKSVEEGHYIGHEVNERVIKDLPDVKEVTVHVEPKTPRFRRKI